MNYENKPMQYTAIFHSCKKQVFSDNFLNIFLIFAQNMNCGCEAVLTSTHNLCFRAKIRKNKYPCKPQFNYTDMFV